MGDGKRESLERMKYQIDLIHRNALTDIGSIKCITPKNKKSVIEMIRGVSEIIVYGQQKRGDYFE